MTVEVLKVKLTIFELEWAKRTWMCSAPPTRELNESSTGERRGSEATLRRVRGEAVFEFARCLGVGTGMAELGEGAIK